MKIKIISEPTYEKPFLIIYKPKNLPSAPLSKTDTDNALYQAMQLFPQIKRVKGKKEIEYGLLHRLDTATDGLLLICTSQHSYDFLIEQQNQNKFIKTYIAECDFIKDNALSLGSFPPLPENAENIINIQPLKSEIKIKSFFRSYGKNSREVRPVTEKSNKSSLQKVGKQKEYETCIAISKNGEKYFAECKITQGFRHQVRSHLAWIGFPIINDKLYNSNFRTEIDEVKKNNHLQHFDEDDLKFTSTKLEFEYPKGDLNSYEIAFTWT